MNQLYIALAFLILAALSVVYIGGRRFYQQYLKGAFGEETIDTSEAVMFPIGGSVALFSFYVALRFIPREYVSAAISAYLGIASIFALSRFLTPYLRPGLVSGVLCIAVGGAYLYTRHWVLNNVLGFAMAVMVLEVLPLDSFLASSAALIGLFFYDIFWVFGTDVMLSVATGIDGPIKLVFPYRIFSKDHSRMSLLGLGDLVIPGLFISQTLVFSQRIAGRGNFYFYVALCAYAASLVTTMAVMLISQHGQPALLFITPGLLVSFAVAVVVKGDGRLAANFSVSDTSPLPEDNEAQEKRRKAAEERKRWEAEELAAQGGSDGIVASIVDVFLSLFGLDKESKEEAAKVRAKAKEKKE